MHADVAGGYKKRRKPRSVISVRTYQFSLSNAWRKPIHFAFTSADSDPDPLPGDRLVPLRRLQDGADLPH